ncbi:sensor histidine kinase [Mucilaginibacter celer]|uniref:Histidine kinase n=1 Tax=Mucilaginibacter celer TaxID=2305508 RepID=A0A494VS99_9SPHI|nr:histidine kinase [Mucilaginibacter celer]AYL97319.1 histidine kinase [Mucilaginibacter celer]
MKQDFGLPLINIKLPRFWQHLIFWIIVSLFITSLYSLQTNFWVSLRNNLLYMPIQIAYYYAIAYWLVPKYAFQKRYVMFILMLIPLIFAVMFISRTVGILFVAPYLIRVMHVTDAGYLESTSRPFFEQLFDGQSLVNSFKGNNLFTGFVLAIKLFKMWYERKQAALEAELNALKAQVHPHFLFNTLNNLYSLSLNNSPKSPQAIMGLSDILRYMLYECSDNEVPLEKEIFMMQQYVKLEKLRYEDRIDINFTITGDLKDKTIAPLLILPFIENAFKHGASEKVGDTWINIDVSVTLNHFKLKVANSKPERPVNTGDNAPGHIGLKNVSTRLNLLYPNTSRLKIMDEEDTFFVVLDLDLKIKRQAQPLLNQQPAHA